MLFGFVFRPRQGERAEVRDSRLRAKARLRETYARERFDSQIPAGESRHEESAFRGEVAPAAAKPSWAHYFLDDRFTLARPKPEELEPIAAEFTYQPVPGVEITVVSPDQGWELWEKAQAALDQAVGVAKGAFPGSSEPKAA